MADFYDNQVIGIRRVGTRDGGATISSDLLLPNGQTVASIKMEKPDTKTQLLKALHLPFVIAPLNAEFIAPNNKVLLRVIKAFSLKEFLVTLQDEQRRVVGYVRRVPTATRTDSGTYDYTVTDPGNALICLVRGNWRVANQMQVLDERGATLGKISRKDPAMGSNFTVDPKFHIMNCYAPPQSSTKRLALVGVGCALDMIVD